MRNKYYEKTKVCSTYVCSLAFVQHDGCLTMKEEAEHVTASGSSLISLKTAVSMETLLTRSLLRIYLSVGQ